MEESLPPDERLVDFLAKMTDDEESILHVEFQTKYDLNMPVYPQTLAISAVNRYQPEETKKYRIPQSL